MSLMVGPRLKAVAHLWAHGNLFRGHRIWRWYRHHGLDTLAVFCECGAVFGNKTGDGHPMRTVQAMRGRGGGMKAK